jgi:hypothetical protein
VRRFVRRFVRRGVRVYSTGDWYSAPVNCYTCEQTAINACKRCARPYCEDHGNAQYCSECLRPASALPSFNLYRGALLTLLVGTAVAVFLLIRPPGETTGSAPLFVNRAPTATAEASEPQVTPTSGTPATSTPDRTLTPVATAAPTESPFIEYVVQEGDSLFGIAEANLPPGTDLIEYVNAIASLNGFSPDDPVLNIGGTLLLPRPPAQ